MIVIYGYNGWYNNITYGCLKKVEKIDPHFFYIHLVSLYLFQIAPFFALAFNL